MTPAAAPLFMPTQDLSSAPAGGRRRARPDVRTLAARVLTFGGTLLLVAYGAREMHAVVDAGGVTWLEGVFLFFFVLTFAWIAFPACAAVAGVLFARRATRDADGPGDGRIAIVMPIYNEDPSRTCAALEAMALELDRTDEGTGGGTVDGAENGAENGAEDGADGGADNGAARYEIFLLSDTTDPGVLVRETAAAQELRHRLRDVLPVHYRHRFANIGRKAGNVREFVERWGARYEAMLVLDADSLMDARTVRALVADMDAHPDVALVQTVPRLAGGRTPFARLQQFAGSVYGPVVARGLDAWAGDDGNFWGHNALIRTAAFAGAAGLPELPGRRPFGGGILSHDFVEAGLLRRAGWRVRMLPALDGSFEDGPPSLLDSAVRDRRWAQGNVQHLAVLPTRGLAWPNRVHLVNGVLSYAASPLWLALVVVGLALSLQAGFARPSYFGDGLALFPTWPTFDSERMLTLFIVSLVVLLLPKALGTLEAILRPTLRRAHGGTLRILASATFETVLSALLAPIMMLVHTRILFQIALGQDSGWELQRRDGEAYRWRDVWRRHWLHEALGIGALVALSFVAPNVVVWLIPVLLGLTLAAPLSRWTSDPVAGDRLRDLGLLRIPAETHSPAVFDVRDTVLPRYRAVVADATPGDVLGDDDARGRHYACVSPPPPSPRGAPDPARLGARAKLDETRNLDEALGWLERRELVALLCDRSLYEDWRARSKSARSTA